MAPYLKSNGITAATLTIMKNGVVLYTQAYGYKDLAGTFPLSTNALMTGASIVKPVTASAIQKLANVGSLALTDKVFCALGVTPSSANHCWISSTWVTSTDVRIQNITISHLLAHKGGWDRGLTNCYAYQVSPSPTRTTLTNNGNPCDPIQHEAIVQAVGSLTSAPTLEQDIKFFMNGRLDFAPGGPAIYSNFGYMLLGLIVESASGSDFNTYVTASILSPLGVSSSDFKTNSSLLVNADSREPNYITTLTSSSVYAPGTTVSARNGVLNAANFLAAATTAMTSKAMATFAGNFKIDTDANGVDGANNGLPLNGTTNSAYHRGDLPGTAAMLRQLPSGVSYAVLMNKNDLYEGSGTRKDYPSDVKTGIDAAITLGGY
jgi:N-acyl-D-amino-acid deacylase